MKEASMTDTNNNTDFIQKPKEKAMTSNDTDAGADIKLNGGIHG
jgi:hypothetical protein